MSENEIIVVNGIPDKEYDELIEACVKYAVISLPFTVNRMSIHDDTQRALNIAKGKIAEKLFGYFCAVNHIHPNFDQCTTPFWTVDKRDFILDNKEWDIKNNFIYHLGNTLQNHEYTDLPALIPNRFEGDQWSKRQNKYFTGTSDVCFLFTFLKNADAMNNDRCKSFLEITLSEQQTILLKKLYHKYLGKPQHTQPFKEEDFWNEMTKYSTAKFYHLHFKPHLIITSYADSNHWQLFRDTDVDESNGHFGDYLQPHWYTKSGNNTLDFMNGVLKTRIKNATLPVSTLPSFLSLYPHLNKEIYCAEIAR